MFHQREDGKMVLDQDLVQHVWDFEGVHIVITVPEGFATDGASIPRLLWPIIGPPIGSTHFLPAIVHDYLCERSKTKAERTLTDAIFFKLLRDISVPKWKRIAMYIGIGFYGRYIWKPPEA
jgi:hypothetical protein